MRATLPWTGRLPMPADHDRWLSVTPPLPPDVWFRQPLATLPFPLQESRHRLFARARHGLFRSLQALGFARGDEALVPAYHHGSEIETLCRAGLRCMFYDCREDLAPQEDELGRLVGPRTRALYLIHYFGIPQDAPHWRAWCDERGLMLIEDAAQSWLARHEHEPVGWHGDVAIYCLHKSFGLPDGGAVVGRSPPAGPNGKSGVGLRQLLVRHGEWLAQRLSIAGRLRESERFSHHEAEVPQRSFSLGDPDAPPAAASTFLLPRIADPAAAEKRRRNHARLLTALREHVPTGFEEIPAGSAPYVFLVRGAKKHEVLDRLAARGIIGGSLWQTPHPSLDVESFTVARRMRSTLVGLPVHQELRATDLSYVTSAFSAAVGS